MLAGYEASHGWASFSMNASIVPPPVHGTSITILSLGANEGVMSIYVNNGSPTQLHFNITDGWTLDGQYSKMRYVKDPQLTSINNVGSLSGSIDPDAALTGLITNYDNATAETADVKIIATKPESSGGIFLWQDGRLDTSWLNSNLDPPLAAVSNSSSITSNQAGRVYAIEKKRITEWRWENSNSSFVRVGPVNTNLQE